MARRYIELCTLFDSLFLISRTFSGKIINNMISKIKFNIELCMCKSKYLRLSMMMITILKIKDHLLE